jgi:hypothetical protein
VRSQPGRSRRRAAGTSRRRRPPDRRREAKRITYRQRPASDDGDPEARRRRCASHRDGADTVARQDNRRLLSGEPPVPAWKGRSCVGFRILRAPAASSPLAARPRPRAFSSRSSIPPQRTTNSISSRPTTESTSTPRSRRACIWMPRGSDSSWPAGELGRGRWPN